MGIRIGSPASLSEFFGGTLKVYAGTPPQNPDDDSGDAIYDLVFEGIERMTEEEVAYVTGHSAKVTALYTSIEESGLNHNELVDLKDAVVELIEQYKLDAEAKVKSMIDQFAAEGVVLGTLVKPSGPIKYTDGINTWTGKGKMPGWLKDAIAATGNDLASFEVVVEKD
jgi:hypothetical protein